MNREATDVTPYSLSFTTSTLTTETPSVRGLIKTRSMANIPLIFETDMRLAEIPCAWLFYVSLESARTSSPRTWANYGSALANWLNTCALSNWDWQHVDSSHVTAYRDNLCNTPMAGNRSKTSARSSRTVNYYLGVLDRFYKWCVENGHVARNPFIYELRHVKNSHFGMLAHTRKDDLVYVNTLKLPETRLYPAWIQAADLRRIKYCLSPRNNLIVDWSLTTGARRWEICLLEKTQLPTISEVLRTVAPLMTIRITNTKGGLPRNIYPPTTLVRRTLLYIAEERSLKLTPLTKDPLQVFITKDGVPLPPKRVSTTFRDACKAAGVSATFHGLRHTFAIRTIDKLYQLGINESIDPNLIVKVLLGHKNQTTTDIYTLARTKEAVDLIMQSTTLIGNYDAI